MPGSGVVTCSARYLAALPSSHQIATSAEIWGGTALLATLQVEASTTVTVDRNNLIRRTCSAVLTDPYAGTAQSIVPTTAQGFMSPYGNELVLYRGITYSDGTQELIQLGCFGLDDVIIDDSAPDLVITLTGGDRGVACQHAGFKDVYNIAPGTNIGTAIQALISSLTTGLTIPFVFAPTTAVTPTTPIVYQPGDDPWSMAVQLAQSIGYELFFNPTGACTFLPVPNPLAQAVSWSYIEGTGNIATELVRTISRDNAPNYIIRDGSGSGVANGSTSISAASNGASLPQSTINVAATSSFANATGPGTIWVQSNTGLYLVSFTGSTSLTFTGCSGGSGTLATGNSVTEPMPRGIAFDANPMSPTYIGGSYGEQVDYSSSSLYTSQPQAQAAADADLLLALGSIESLEVKGVPKPDTDVDDVVLVTRARSGLASELYVIDSFILGFGTDGVLDFVGRQIGGFPTPS